jgi:hypothetical protein
MGWEAAAIMGGTSLLGGILGGNAAQNAAQTSANAQLQAGQMAADAAKFRPVGVTSNFGTSNFQFSPEGYLTGAGYTLDPRLQAAQGALLGGIPQSLQDQANIQAMGRQYMAQSPQEQAQQYIANQQALLQPLRDRQLAALGTQNYNQGTTGLSVAQGGTLQAANPYASALFNQMGQQDLALAADATRAGQQQYQFGQGLLSSAYQPYTAGLQAAGATEALGQGAFDLGTSLGAKQSTAGANVGQALLTSGINAAKTTQAGQFDPLAAGLMGIGSSPYLGYAANQYFNPAQTAVTAPIGLGGYGAGANYGFGSGSSYALPSAGGSYGLQPTGGLGLNSIWNR